MHPTLETIHSRRSIRHYENKPLEESLLQALFAAGFSAPSAMNRRPWHFFLLDERELLDHIPTFHPYTKFITEAPCAIVVCGDTEISPTFYVDDCAAATQNILLAATALGLGSCWCGIEHTDRAPILAQMLHLPANIAPYSLIVLGHPAEEKEPQDRFTPERIHRNHW